MFGYPVTFS